MPRLDQIVDYLFSHPGSELVLETNSTGEYRKNGTPQVPVFRQTLRTGQILLLFAEIVPEPQSQALLAGEAVDFTYRATRGLIAVHMHMVGADIVARVRVAAAPVASTPTPPPAPAGLAQLIVELSSKGASHLYLCAGQAPFLRIDGRLHPAPEVGTVTEEALRGALVALAPASVRELVKSHSSFDFTAVQSEHVLHVRASDSREGFSVVVQQRPRRVPAPGELGLVELMAHTRTLGLTVVGAPDGSAQVAVMALAQAVLEERAAVVWTVEPCIEHALHPGRGVVRQLEIGTHVESAADALARVPREGVDVVVLPSVDEPAVLAEAVALADAGHVVLGGMWARGATEVVTKAWSLLGGHRGRQARLTDVLRGVVAGVRLGGQGRWLWEHLELADTLRSALEAQRSPRELVRRPLEVSLVELVQAGRLGIDEALRLAPDRHAAEAIRARAGMRAA